MQAQCRQRGVLGGKVDVAPTVTNANRAVRREVRATQCEVEDGVLKIEMSLA